MELLENKEKPETAALPEPEPRYKPAESSIKRNEHGQAWLRIAAATVLAVILVILLVLLARWIYHKAHNHATPASPPAQNTPAASSNNPPAAHAPATGSNGSSSASSGNSTNSNHSVSKSGNQISNTGPGNVVAIFAGASLAAAGLHYLVSVRRFAKASKNL